MISTTQSFDIQALRKTVPYMAGANYRISGDLANTDNVMNNTFWIGVQLALARKKLEFAAQKIENYWGDNF